MESLIQVFEKYAYVIAPCLRGFGFSSYNNNVESLEDFAIDIKLLMEE